MRVNVYTKNINIQGLDFEIGNGKKASAPNKSVATMKGEMEGSINQISTGRKVGTGVQQP